MVVFKARGKQPREEGALGVGPSLNFLKALETYLWTTNKKAGTAAGARKFLTLGKYRIIREGKQFEKSPVHKKGGQP